MSLRVTQLAPAVAGEASWPTDMSDLELPPDGSMLYSLELPPSGGNTGEGFVFGDYSNEPL
jgi:hypothetical protein